jgi:hypothetical protein
MSRRIDKAWVVFASVENGAHDKCVDIFYRPDGSFGFEEFRRDVEEQGEWTPLSYYSGSSYPSSPAAYDAAEAAIPWLADVLRRNPALKRHPRS